MWLVTRHGFVSAVEDRDDPTVVQVRARRRDHLEDVLGMMRVVTRSDQEITESLPEIIVTPGADYRYRALLSRAQLAQLVVALADDIHYSNFKAAVARGKYRFRAGEASKLERIWTLLGELQPCGPYSWWKPRRGEVPKAERKLQAAHDKSKRTSRAAWS